MHAITPPHQLLGAEEAAPPPDAPPAQPCPAPALPEFEQSRRGWRTMLVHARWLLLFVALPTTLVAIYFGLIASRQYVSEAHFVVRAAGQASAASPGLGQLLGMGGAMSPSQTESLGLGDYLTSHDAVYMLERGLGLAGMFQGRNIDWLSRLREQAPPETLLKYYREQVKVSYNSETGITTLKVRTFRPEDSLRVATTLLELGEQRVNRLNERAYQDALRVTRGQLDDAERELAAVKARMTGFRQQSRDIDPQRSSSAQIELVSQLQARLATARAQLAAMGQAVRSTSPQYVAMRQRVEALQAQVAGESGKLTGGDTAMAAGLGNYEELQLRQEFAAKRYAAAAAAMETAREQAVRQQLFVVRVVEPNLPVKSLYPARLKIIFGVFIGLLVAYGIGWLIVAGVREHAA